MPCVKILIFNSYLLLGLYQNLVISAQLVSGEWNSNLKLKYPLFATLKSAPLYCLNIIFVPQFC